MWDAAQPITHKHLYLIDKYRSTGGGSGIRTLGTLSRPSVFKTGAIDHSAKPPLWGVPKSVKTILQSGKIHALLWGNLPIWLAISCLAG